MSEKNLRICAVVVTYNRKEILEKCLQALFSQDYTDFDILIVDNASTDGTGEFIRGLSEANLIYRNTGANTGGAGGFYSGMRYAYENGYDWIWVMDDDVVPAPTALHELVEHLKYDENISYLASAVYSAEGDTAMNTPEISRYSTNGYLFWYENLEYGMVRLEQATFVSLLINRRAVEKCGLPCRDYFIWGDDIEYTLRIGRNFGPGYLVGSSKVRHLRTSSSKLDIKKETDPTRIRLHYYYIRNLLINMKEYFGKKECRRTKRNYRRECLKILLKGERFGALKIRTILKAIRDFNRGHYAKKAFERRFEISGQDET